MSTGRKRLTAAQRRFTRACETLARVRRLSRNKFDALLAKTNKEHPAPSDVRALSDLLNGHASMELWRSVASAGQMAELTVVDNVNQQLFKNRSAGGSRSERMLEASTPGIKEGNGL